MNKQQLQSVLKTVEDYCLTNEDYLSKVTICSKRLDAAIVEEEIEGIKQVDSTEPLQVVKSSTMNYFIRQWVFDHFSPDVSEHTIEVEWSFMNFKEVSRDQVLAVLDDILSNDDVVKDWQEDCDRDSFMIDDDETIYYKGQQYTKDTSEDIILKSNGHDTTAEYRSNLKELNSSLKLNADEIIEDMNDGKEYNNANDIQITVKGKQFNLPYNADIHSVLTGYIDEELQ